MATQTQDSERVDIAEPLDRVVAAGDVLLSRLKRDENSRRIALQTLSAAVDDLGDKLPVFYPELSSTHPQFAQAAAQIQTGQLLIAAGASVESGEGTELRKALDTVRAQRREFNQARPVPLFFKDQLLTPPPQAANDAAALDLFQKRAVDTLDNMVTEARDVILIGIKKIEKSFDSFSSTLIELGESFSSADAPSIIRAGIERIISGLKILTEFLKSSVLQKGLKFVTDAVNLDKNDTLSALLPALLSAAFGCDKTKKTIGGLRLNTTVHKANLESAGAHMAELCVQYVGLLKLARWVLTAVGAAGGLLVLTGAGAHISAIGVPVAYAIVTVATVLIGMDFAESRMHILIAPLLTEG